MHFWKSSCTKNNNIMLWLGNSIYNSFAYIKNITINWKVARNAGMQQREASIIPFCVTCNFLTRSSSLGKSIKSSMFTSSGISSSWNKQDSIWKWSCFDGPSRVIAHSENIFTPPTTQHSIPLPFWNPIPTMTAILHENRKYSHQNLFFSMVEQLCKFTSSFF